LNAGLMEVYLNEESDSQLSVSSIAKIEGENRSISAVIESFKYANNSKPFVIQFEDFYYSANYSKTKLEEYANTLEEKLSPFDHTASDSFRLSLVNFLNRNPLISRSAFTTVAYVFKAKIGESQIEEIIKRCNREGERIDSFDFFLLNSSWSEISSYPLHWSLSILREEQ
jgi:hypothetical protein